MWPRSNGAPREIVAPLAGAGGLVVGLLGVFGRRPALIGITAVSGAQQLLSAGPAVLAFYGPAPTPLPDMVTPAQLAVFLTLVTAGLLIQFLTPRSNTPTPSPSPMDGQAGS